MREIPVEELEQICPAIHADAVRVGCTDARITGRIWPGGASAGPAEEGIRVVEYSWLKAAVVKGEAVFEADNPQSFLDLLRDYGLTDEEVALVPGGATLPDPLPLKPAPTEPPKLQITVEMLARTKRELYRHASAAGLSIGEWLDRMFAGKE
jgi:hypothetical protein